MTDLTLNFNITEQDYVNFRTDRHYFQAKKTSIVAYLILASIFILFISMSLKISISGFRMVSLYFSIAAVFAVIYLLIYYTKIGKPVFQKLFLSHVKKGNARGFIGEHSLTLAESSIERTTPDCSSQIDYSAVERVGKGHRLFYIYCGAVQAIIVPVAAFSDDQQKTDFFNLLSEKAGTDISAVT
jgi:hypothetical protein